MTTETLHACTECGNDYADLEDGMCRDCANEAEGLCACGRAINPGYRQCAECAAEDRADELFHANR